MTKREERPKAGSGTCGSRKDYDAALARRAAAGEDLAWREIYDGTRERLFALIHYHVGNREEALDILQETYVAALGGIGSYRGSGSLEAWLCGIALRRSRDWKRKLLRKWKNTVSLDHVAEPAAAESEADPLEAARIREALGKLPGRQRTVVLLRDFMGYSFRETATAVGIGEATARVHYHRAKEALRTLLEEIAPPPGRGRTGGRNS